MTAMLSQELSPLTQSVFEHPLPVDALEHARRTAFECLQNRGFPTKSAEAFRYFPVRLLHEAMCAFPQAHAISNEEIEAHILPECTKCCLVFVDGHFNPSLSRLEGVDPRVSVLSLTDAMRTYGHFLKNRFAKILAEEKDPFALFNLAYHPSAAFIYLPPKVVTTPLQILCVNSQPTTFILPRLHVFAGSYSKMELIVTNTVAEASLQIPAFDLALEEGAQVQVLHKAQTEERGWNLASTRATLKKAASFSYFHWSRGAGIARNDARVWLQGEEAQADLKGVWMLDKKAQSHAQVRVDHEAPHTQSMQLFKGVLADLSQSSFEGKIYVQPQAQKTQAYQLNKNLLLSPHVKAHAKPNLEIFADDVKASHGATVARLDDELLFYLKSRGITESQAKSMLVEGFCREVLDSFTVPSLAKEATHAVHSYLS